MEGIERIKILASEVEDDDLLEIVNYLVSRKDMNEKYLNEEKSLKQMCTFINDTARKELAKKKKTGFVGQFISNDTVFNWAVHYWDESNKDLGLEKEKRKSETKKVETTKKVENIVKNESKKNKEWIPEGQLSLF